MKRTTLQWFSKTLKIMSVQGKTNGWLFLYRANMRKQSEGVLWQYRWHFDRFNNQHSWCWISFSHWMSDISCESLAGCRKMHKRLERRLQCNFLWQFYCFTKDYMSQKKNWHFHLKWLTNTCRNLCKGGDHIICMCQLCMCCSVCCTECPCAVCGTSTLSYFLDVHMA